MSPRYGLLSLLIVSLGACTFGVPIGKHGKLQIEFPPKTKKSQQGNPSSYVVYGKRYYVLKSGKGFVQRGIASWYGPKFHGRPTSSGEVYNMHEMTAAHKTLPIPIYVHVRNLDNGRSVIVRVNDRGPFIEGRIIDLSYAAAKKLGIDVPGTARVEIKTLERGQTEPSSIVRTIPLTDRLEQDIPLYIQMGSFASHLNADLLIQNLIEAKEASVGISRMKTSDGLYYRVRLGPLYDIDEANAIMRRLKTKGFQTARIVVHNETDKP